MDPMTETDIKADEYPKDEPSFSNIFENRETRENNGGSRGNKRSRGLEVSDSAVDDILGMICNEMGKLSTADNVEKIGAFMQVLRCTSDEANFYLDSANWDIETAVVLWLDSNNNEAPRHYSESSAIFGQRFTSTMNSWSREAVVNNKKWLPLRVKIEGLPEHWEARVSRHAGVIYFINTLDGTRQQVVPPGFADDVAENEIPGKRDMITEEPNEDTICREDSMNNEMSINVTTYNEEIVVANNEEDDMANTGNNEPMA